MLYYSMENELKTYLEAIKEDYRKWSHNNNLDSVHVVIRDNMYKEFCEGLEIIQGSQYLKVITKNGSSRSVHSFIVREDGPKFKKGDILKAAGWSVPAKNVARGNIFGQYRILWTGAEYCR